MARLRLKRGAGAGARDGGGVWIWASGHFPVVSRGILLCRGKFSYLPSTVPGSLEHFLRRKVTSKGRSLAGFENRRGLLPPPTLPSAPLPGPADLINQNPAKPTEEGSQANLISVPLRGQTPPLGQ